MSFNPHTPAYRASVWSLWKKCQINSEDLSEAVRIATKIMANLPHYQTIAAATGVPPHILGCIHYREGDMDFGTWLANGDPLMSHGAPAKTVDDPAGLGPVSSFDEGGILSIQRETISKIKAFDIVTTLIELEAYNGEGYHSHFDPNGHPENSPYIWSATNAYTSGKYVSDGNWDPRAVDQQLGCAAILMALRDHFQIDLNEVPA